MSSRSSLDRDSFQAFLANVYAVQRSGLDTEFLSAVLEMQRSISKGECGLHRAMLIVAERALKISDATGIAIALLEDGELVYRAASGTAASDMGRHVPAVLAVSSKSAVRREILRVENAQDDLRVEAEVCRQFGANALLMLPIYTGQVVVGVMQVLFSDAHSFVDQEVLAYRLLLGVVEGAMARDQKDAAAQPAPNVVPQMLATCSSHPTGPVDNTVKPPANKPDAVEQPVRPALSLKSVSRFNPFWIRLRAAIGKKVHGTWAASTWQIGTAITVALVLATANWVAYHNPSTHSLIGRTTSASDENTKPVLATPLSDETQRGKDRSTVLPSSGFKRVRVGPNEVDYVADDVTIRRFTTALPKRRMQPGEREVNIGDDVTVRYLARPPMAASPATTSGVSAGKETAPSH